MILGMTPELDVAAPVNTTGYRLAKCSLLLICFADIAERTSVTEAWLKGVIFGWGTDAESCHEAEDGWWTVRAWLLSTQRTARQDTANKFWRNTSEIMWSILLHQQYPATILIKHEYFQPKWAQINLKSPMGQFQRIWREKAIFDNPSQRDYYKLSKSKVQFREQSTACLAQSHPPTDQKQKARNRQVNCKLVFLLLTNANKHYSQYSERWDATWADSELKWWQRWYQLKGS